MKSVEVKPASRPGFDPGERIDQQNQSINKTRDTIRKKLSNYANPSKFSLFSLTKRRMIL
jgi:hypothetical protein